MIKLGANVAAGLLVIALLAGASVASEQGAAATAGKGWKTVATPGDSCVVESAVSGSATIAAVRFVRPMFGDGFAFQLVGFPTGMLIGPIEVVYKFGNSPAATREGYRNADPVDDRVMVTPFALTPAEERAVLDGEPLVLALPREPMVAISTVLLPGAARRLTACREQRLRAIGIDPATAVSVAVPPKGDLQRLFKSDDYPAAAAKLGVSGSVKAWFVVGADGRVKDCHAVPSSGSPDLDRRTCEIILRRGRFEPARDAAGKAVPSSKTTRIMWMLTYRNDALSNGALAR